MPGSQLEDYGSLADSGDGDFTWRLCLQAPSALSITVLLRDVQLPLTAQLYVYSPAATTDPRAACTARCRLLTTHDLHTNGGLLVGPVSGEVAVLEYHQPASVEISSRHFAARVESVLLGVRPLSFAGQEELRESRSSMQQAGRSSSSAEQAAEQTAAVQTAALLADSVVISEAGSSPAMDPASEAEAIEQAILEALQARAGDSLTCNLNVACEPGWDLQANAVVLLAAFDANEGYFCTGTMVNSPNADQYMVSANHCLGLTDGGDTAFWGVVFSYEQTCYPDNSAPTYEILQGLEVVWNNEISDVMLLRLLDDIPTDYSPYYMGWDASSRLQTINDSAVIHQPLGDYKKISFSYNPTTGGTYLVPGEDTHYVVTYSLGDTENGSSGAMLIDATTRLGVGVLTGSPDAGPTCGGGHDYFGSLAVAWEEGLWEYLGADGADGQAAMAGREPSQTGPGLVVTPDSLVVQEGGDPVQLQIMLSDPPAYNDQILVEVTVSPTGSPPVNVSTQLLAFAGFDWNVPQQLLVYPGSVLALPTPITYLPFNDSGTLLPAAASEPPFDLGNTTAGQFAQRLQAGSAVYYSWRPASRRTVSVGACSPTLELEMVVFVDGFLQWSSYTDCGGISNPACGTSHTPAYSCVGFQNIELPAVDGLLAPHIIAVYSRNHTSGSYEFEIIKKDES
ncbi:hypothetical protein N2152v2_005427 [Parachlorella kessleri]